MMALRCPTLLGAGRVAAPRRPARRTAVRVVPAGRGRRDVCGGRVRGHVGAAAAAVHRRSLSGVTDQQLAAIDNTFLGAAAAAPPG